MEVSIHVILQKKNAATILHIRPAYLLTTGCKCESYGIRYILATGSNRSLTKFHPKI
jgi:hypothetical protein